MATRIHVSSAPAVVFLALCMGATVTGCSKHEPREDKPAPTLQHAVIDPPAPPAVALAPAPPLPAAPATPTARSLEGKTVLHIGDSMVGGDGGLHRALSAKFAERGAKVVREYKVSESIASFDKSSRLNDMLVRHDPDIVLLTLGANDALVPFPQALVNGIESIAKKLAKRECYWIGPPMWKADKAGFVATLREHSAPCKYFDASALKLERRDDGIHPTDRGGAVWAAAFWEFFEPLPAPAVSLTDRPR